MSETKKLVDGKRLLIVDDEPDVLDSLEEILSMCDTVRANNFDEAKELLESQYFDMAILDIMGVDGYRLLEIAAQRNVTAVMLTAHALSPEHIKKSYKEGAAYYVPKDEMANLPIFLDDVLDAQKKGKNTWWRWLERLGETYCEKKFGPDWRNKDLEFWEKFSYWE